MTDKKKEYKETWYYNDSMAYIKHLIVLRNYNEAWKSAEGTDSISRILNSKLSQKFIFSTKRIYHTHMSLKKHFSFL
jgi:hypothetical protein